MARRPDTGRTVSRAIARRRRYDARVALPDRSRIVSVLREVAGRYPPPLVAGQMADAERMAFHLGLLEGVPSGGRVADIGGGVGLFSTGARALGFDAVLVDDFKDDVNLKEGQGALQLHRELGVEIIDCDVIEQGVDFPESSLDAVTSFDSMEHWHHSPRRLFHALVRALKPGGLFVLGAPNCVNMRKRITVPLGRGKWSSLDEWYRSERFRGHVREPDVRDLRAIAADLNLRHWRVLGRNWQGYKSGSALVRALTRVADLPLRAFPSLCADLYLVGQRHE